MEWTIAGAIAAALAFLELNKTFYIPKGANSRLRLALLEVGFLTANSAVAVGLYFALRQTEPFKDWDRSFSAAVIGTSYLAILTARLTTIKFENREFPVGVEPFYLSAKDYVYRQINTVARDARQGEVRRLADSKTLAELVADAKSRIRVDSLMTKERRQEALAWILRVVEDTTASDQDKREDIANFMLSDQMN